MGLLAAGCASAEAQTDLPLATRVMLETKVKAREAAPPGDGPAVAVCHTGHQHERLVVRQTHDYRRTLGTWTLYDVDCGSHGTSTRHAHGSLNGSRACHGLPGVTPDADPAGDRYTTWAAGWPRWQPTPACAP